MTTDRAGMLMPRANVSVANTTFTSPSTKQASTASLKGGTIPAWWAAMPASTWSRHAPNCSAARSRSDRSRTCSSMIVVMRSRSSAVVSRGPERLT